MKLRVIGCSGAESPGHHASAFLIDNELLLDAGTVGTVLSEEEQCRISDILISHPHLDHIRGIPFLADNILASGGARQINVISSAEIITAIRVHILNGVIWPDFSKIPSPESPVLSCMMIVPEQEFTIRGYAITAFRVNHPVPAVGYRISGGAATLLYTGDTGPTSRIWEMAGDITTLLVEVSFPDDMEEMALLSGHLTPALLRTELAKLGRLPRQILVTHLKPVYFDITCSELTKLNIPGLEIIRQGMEYEV